MASAHDITFLNNVEITNENLRTLLFDEATGQPVADDFNIINSTAVTAAQTLSSKSIDHILVGDCVGCTVVVTLQMSPDGVNWCDCPLSNGEICTVTCTEIAGDCTAKIIDVPVLQYVRIKIGPAGSLSEPGDQKFCTVKLHFTLN